MNDLFSKSVIRTPVKSFEYFQRIINYSESELFNILIKDHFFLNALNTASPMLYGEFIKLDEKAFCRNQKMVLTCIKYLTRLSTRCTPFGLFSGNLVVDNYQNSDCGISRSLHFDIHVRLDSNLYQMLYESIERDNELKPFVKFYCNTSLYEHNTSYRYVEFTYDQKNGRKYALTQVKKDFILKKIIDQCLPGEDYNSLVRLIISLGYEKDDAVTYLDELINAQVIVSELNQSSTGLPPELVLLENLNRIYKKHGLSSIKEKIDVLESIISRQRLINTLDQKVSLRTAENLDNLLKHRYPNKRNQVFLHKEINFTTENKLSKSYNKLLEEAMFVLERITNKNSIEETRITKFKKLFTEKYGDSVQRLSDVLDMESGIGYGEFLNSGGIDDNPVIFNLQNSTSEYKNNIEIHSKDNYLISAIKTALKNNLPVRLKYDDLKKYTPDDKYTGATFAFFGELYKNQEQKDVFHIKGIASSPINLLGRFTNSNEKINELAQEIAIFEEQYFEDFLCAEIDYIPESTLGNVILRKQFRNNHISYLGSPAHKNNISIQEISVCVRDNKIIITNAENKKIMPFYSNAFNVNHPKNLPFFEFFADIKYQYDYTNSKNLNIDKYHQFMDHIPRIEYKDLIIRRSSWIIKFSELNNTDISELQGLLKTYKVNRYITFEEGDNELLIDTDNLFTLEILLKELEKKKSLIVREYLLHNFNSAVTVNDENLNNEVIFCKKNTVQSAKKYYIQAKNKKVQQSFSPGSEWIYFKIYIGNKSVDDLLIKIDKIVNEMIKINSIHSFFYIKYVEDSFQLRLRFKLNAVEDFAPVFNKVSSLLERWKKNKLLHKYSLETYERELHRYGYSQIGIFESIFHKDSLISLHFIKNSKRGDYDSWLFCAEYIYTLLTKYFNDKSSVLEFITYMKNSYDIEFNSNKNTTKSINLNYNQRKNLLNEIFFNKKSLIKETEKLQADILKLLKRIEYSSKTELFSYLGSVFHMHIIRIVRSNNRLYEYMIYCFLLKIAKTQNALSK